MSASSRPRIGWMPPPVTKRLLRPAYPITHRPTHYEFQIVTFEPGQLFAKKGDAFPPAGCQARDVGSPEYSARPEGLEYTMQNRVRAGEWVRVGRHAGHAGRFDRDVGVRSEGQQVIEMGNGFRDLECGAH